MLRVSHLAHFAPLRLALAIGAFLVGASFCFFANSVHANGSFYFISKLPIPWWAYGVILLAAGACLVFEKTRPIGYLLGAVIYTHFTIGAWLAVIGGIHSLHLPAFLSLPRSMSGNLFAASNLATVAVVYWSSLKISIYKQVDPARKV